MSDRIGLIDVNSESDRIGLAKAQSDIGSDQEAITNPTHTSTPNITNREVEDAFRSLSDGKSPGYDNIPAELLKTGGETVDILHKIFNLI